MKASSSLGEIASIQLIRFHLNESFVIVSERNELVFQLKN